MMNELKKMVTRNFKATSVFLNAGVVIAFIGLFVPEVNLMIIICLMLAAFSCTAEGYFGKQATEKKRIQLRDMLKNAEWSKLKLIDEELCQQIFQEAIRSGILKIKMSYSSGNLKLFLEEGRFLILSDNDILDYFDVNEKFTEKGKIREIKDDIMRCNYSEIILVNENYKQKLFQSCVKRGLVRIIAKSDEITMVILFKTSYVFVESAEKYFKIV